MLVKSLFRGIQVSDRVVRSSFGISDPLHDQQSCFLPVERNEDKVNLPFNNAPNSIDWSQTTASMDKDNEITVTASHDIPFGVSTLPTNKPISFRSILDRKLPTHLIKAFVTEQGFLCTEKPAEVACIIRLADNCFEQNMVFQWMQDRKSLIARTTRDIRRGEELKAWFSHDLLTDLNIPFLKPQNIISHQNYRCHRCEKIYNQPNPLKVHLAVECILRDQRIMSPSNLNLQLIQASSDDSHSSPSTLTINEERALSENMAVRSPTVTSTFATKEPRTHICMFCGKLYTRKYGLKIHLRTHTGHKPLQCRFCGRPFSDPSNLNKHIRLHSQSNSGSITSPYRCKKCSKILVRRRDLERHLRSRHK